MDNAQAPAKRVSVDSSELLNDAVVDRLVLGIELLVFRQDLTAFAPVFDRRSWVCYPEVRPEGHGHCLFLPLVPQKPIPYRLLGQLICGPLLVKRRSLKLPADSERETRCVEGRSWG
jgi:hypothetical protein